MVVTLNFRKSYTWMHEDTIKWLADTGAHYPTALRPQIQPRIEALRNGQPGRRQPPPPPQPNRWQWQEKRADRRDYVDAHAPTPPMTQAVQLSPRHMVADDKLYMVIQEDFLDIANTVPPKKGSSGKPARASQAVESSSESPRPKPPGTVAKERKHSRTKATRVEAGKMAAQRPAPPSSTENTGKSAKPGKASPVKETPKEKEQAQESSSYESSSSSSSSSDAPEAPQEEEEPDQKEETEQSSDESNTPDLTQKAMTRRTSPRSTR